MKIHLSYTLILIQNSGSELNVSKFWFLDFTFVAMMERFVNISQVGIQIKWNFRKHKSKT